MSDRFLKEAQSGFFIPMRGEQEVNALTRFVDGKVTDISTVPGS